MRTTVLTLGFLSLLLALAACSRPPEPLATHDIQPKVRVVSVAGEGTDVTVVLYSGDLLFKTYRLQAGERLIATAPDGTSVELERGVDMSAFLRRNAYVGRLPEVLPREDVVISFERPDGYAPAPTTVVRIPREIGVTRPTASDNVRTLNETFTVAWDGFSDDEVELSYRVDTCDGLDAEALDDLRVERGFVSSSLLTGGTGIDGATGITTTSFTAPDEATSCSADLIVGRVGDAIDLDPAFGPLRDDSRAVRVSRVVPMLFTEAPAVATADLLPKVRVVSIAGGATEVTVVLNRVGLAAGTYELAFGERLTVTPAGGETVTLRPGVDRSALTEPDAYVATLPALAVGTELVIALERADGDDAPRTTVRIPGEIDVTQPAPGTTLAFGTSYTVRWSELDTGQVELRYDVGTCSGVSDDDFDDVRLVRGVPLALRDGASGSTSISFPRPTDAERCEADLMVGRVNETIDADPAFAGLAAASRAVRVSAPIPLVFVPSVD